MKRHRSAMIRILQFTVHPYDINVKQWMNISMDRVINRIDEQGNIKHFTVLFCFLNNYEKLRFGK